MINLILMAAAAPLALANHLPQDGFKQFKYGMSIEQLRNEGLRCDASGTCSRDVGNESHEKESLFGHPADISVETKNGRLTTIAVTIDISATNLQKQLTSQFGPARAFGYTSFTGRRRIQLLWLAKNGTSLSMVRSPNGEREAAISKAYGTVSYNSVEATKRLKDLEKASAVNKADY